MLSHNTNSLLRKWKWLADFDDVPKSKMD